MATYIHCTSDNNHGEDILLSATGFGQIPKKMMCSFCHLRNVSHSLYQPRWNVRVVCSLFWRPKFNIFYFILWSWKTKSNLKYLNKHSDVTFNKVYFPEITTVFPSYFKSNSFCYCLFSIFNKSSTITQHKYPCTRSFNVHLIHS